MVDYSEVKGWGQSQIESSNKFGESSETHFFFPNGVEELKKY